MLEPFDRGNQTFQAFQFHLLMSPVVPPVSVIVNSSSMRGGTYVATSFGSIQYQWLSKELPDKRSASAMCRFPPVRVQPMSHCMSSSAKTSYQVAKSRVAGQIETFQPACAATEIDRETLPIRRTSVPDAAPVSRFQTTTKIYGVSRRRALPDTVSFCVSSVVTPTRRLYCVAVGPT